MYNRLLLVEICAIMQNFHVWFIAVSTITPLIIDITNKYPHSYFKKDNILKLKVISACLI
jgi:hypothetical protein